MQRHASDFLNRNKKDFYLFFVNSHHMTANSMSLVMLVKLLLGDNALTRKCETGYLSKHVENV